MVLNYEKPVRVAGSELAATVLERRDGEAVVAFKRAEPGGLFASAWDIDLFDAEGLGRLTCGLRLENYTPAEGFGLIIPFPCKG